MSCSVSGSGVVVKARSSFHMEDFEIHSPGEKAIEKSEMAGGRDKDEPKRRRRRKRALGSPADVEAMLAEEESSAINPESMADEAAAGETALAEAAAAQAMSVSSAAGGASSDEGAGGIVSTGTKNGTRDHALETAAEDQRGGGRSGVVVIDTPAPIVDSEKG
jgi:hypothetical protein